ncbi:MAG: glycosyltransferase family 39 protein [Candidatus Gottesmanbacteria bacterium]
MIFLKKLVSNSTIILIIVVLLGFLLRYYRLSEIPIGLHIDEAQLGYNAFSLLKTGRDELGNFLPVHIKIWNYERPLLPTYLTIPGIVVFGLSEFGTRIDTSVIGTISILLVFLLTQSLFKNKALSLLSSFLFTISPWHVMLSRATSDAVIALFFYILGFLFSWRAYEKESKYSVFFSYLFFVLAFFSYLSTRIMIPIILFIFFLMAVRAKKQVSLAFLGVTIIYLIFPFTVFWASSTGRFNQVSIINEHGTKLILEEQIREDGNSFPIFLTRVFHNKIINFSLKAVENFSSYFTADFLIFKGGLPIRYYVPNMGILYFWELPFLLWGFIVLFSKRYRIENTFIIFLWIILGLFSSSLTIEETPNLQRALFILPALQWVVALGLLDLFINLRYFKKMVTITVLSMIIIWNCSYFIHQYTVHTFLRRPWYRFYDMKELVSYVNSVKNKYTSVYLTFNSTEPYVYFLFYNQTNPNIYQKLIKEKGLEYTWNNIDNIKIIREECPIIDSQMKGNILVVYKVNCKLPRTSRIIKKIAFSDGAISLIVVDFPEGTSKIYEQLDYKEEISVD